MDNLLLDKSISFELYPVVGDCDSIPKTPEERDWYFRNC